MKHSSFQLSNDSIYMCAHSLGPISTHASNYVLQGLNTWATLGVAGWSQDNWIRLPFLLGAKIAKMIGALASEVVITDSTCINLYKVLKAALLLNAERQQILTHDDNFPADLYIAQGIRDDTLCQLNTVAADQLIDNITDQIGVVLITHVNYRSSKIIDLKPIVDKAHQMGALVIVDFSHSIGVIPIDVKKLNVDFAVGCTYKYLCGGPGSPSFVFVDSKHIYAKSPIYGWMGHSQPFSFFEKFDTSLNISKFMGTTPAILSLKSLEGSLQIYDDVCMEDIRRLSLDYSSKLIEIAHALVPQLECLSPSSPKARGGHVTFIHQDGLKIVRALNVTGVICDYRDPGAMRFSVHPFFINKHDIHTVANKMAHIIHSKTYLDPKFNMLTKVT